jgi:hypothetical protein
MIGYLLQNGSSYECQHLLNNFIKYHPIHFRKYDGNQKVVLYFVKHTMNQRVEKSLNNYDEIGGTRDYFDGLKAKGKLVIIIALYKEKASYKTRHVLPHFIGKYPVFRFTSQRDMYSNYENNSEYRGLYVFVRLYIKQKY